MVGLPDNIVKESKHRVKAGYPEQRIIWSFNFTGLSRNDPFPMERITATLVPAHLKKEKAGFYVPIAVGILTAIKMPGSYVKMPGVPGFEYK